MPPTKPLTTFWHTAPAPPSTAKLLHVDGARRGPLVNTAVLTNVAPGYAPPGRVLIASSTVAADGSAAAEAASADRPDWSTASTRADWELITCQVIAAALPHQPPPLALRRPARLDSGVFVAGDHRDTASIQGALVSGRRAADAVTRTPVGRPDVGRDVSDRRRDSVDVPDVALRLLEVRHVLDRVLGSRPRCCSMISRRAASTSLAIRVASPQT